MVCLRLAKAEWRRRFNGAVPSFTPHSRRLFFAFLVSAASLATTAKADTVSLTSGDRISGTIVGFDGEKLKIETSYAGTLSVSRAALASASTDGIVTVRFTDGSHASGMLQAAEGNAMTLSGGRGAGKGPFGFGDIAGITPGEELPPRFRWSGRINAGLSQTSGNSDTQTIAVNGAVKARSERHRITADVEYNRETDGSKKTVDNARLRAKHDHFVNEQLYFYTNGGLARDVIADLTLRATVGTGLGYQVFESAERNLSFEAGPSYVHESFDNADDDDSAALRWAVNFDQQLFAGATTVFHEHEGFLDLTGDNAVIAFAKTGFRVPFRDSFNLTAEIDVDYNSMPAPGVDSTDLRYLLTLGYEW